MKWTTASIRRGVYSYSTYYPMKLWFNLCMDSSEYRYHFRIFIIKLCPRTKVNNHSCKVAFRFVDPFGPRAEPMAAVGVYKINEAA